ncbi:hypothetical protein SteCoe_2032 [Stentor coeruleus]|uniref:Cyclic nucleotide-binding domain-containing protein n=1 Tax=Stentor coeruleus TaxID=5963 RepID=A0A1R2D0B9_9CILI|nr:hypothetical protein SteCoe_2032 [Stentor coeruleus]
MKAMENARSIHQKSEKLLSPLINLNPMRKTKKQLSSVTNISGLNPPLSPKSFLSSPVSSLPLIPRLSLHRFSSDHAKVFPQWLLERSDFKKSYLKYSSEVDIGKICLKPNTQRNSLENQELKSWCKSCVFFKSFSDSACNEVCSRLSTQEFTPGQLLIREGEKGNEMFILYKGRVGIYKQGTSEYLEIMGPANVIGESSLENNCLRTANVVAIDNVIALKINKDNYQNVILRQKHKQKVLILKILKEIPFFKELLSAKLEYLAWSMLSLHYDSQQSVYLEGQFANGIYFIKEGSVQLMTYVTVTNKKNLPTTRTGNETMVNRKIYELPVKTVLQGDFFGEEEVISDGKRKHKAVCLENCEILILKKEIIFEIFGEKERNDIGNIHEKPKTKKILAKEHQKKLKLKKIKYTAMLDATCAVPNQSGRMEIDRLLRKKAVLAKSVHYKFHKEINESLVREDCYYKK